MCAARIGVEEPILVEGLRGLEYRGYDSAGRATLTGPHFHLRKRAGRIAERGEAAPLYGPALALSSPWCRSQSAQACVQVEQG
jgi:glutamine phosphoribosylpyrophosphate amidotransferase